MGPKRILKRAVPGTLVGPDRTMVFGTGLDASHLNKMLNFPWNRPVAPRFHLALSIRPRSLILPDAEYLADTF